MAVIANNVKASKAKIQLGVNEYTAHVNSWRIKANTPMDTVTDVSGVARPYVGDPACTLDLDVTQDWTTGALADYIWTNRGNTVTITVQDANATWACSVVLILPTEIGGDYGKAAHNVISMPLIGLPTKSAAV